MAATNTAPAIGIDLGTTFSVVAVVLHGKVEVIANELGMFTTPSYVAFTDEECLVGDAAKHQVAMNPTNTIFDAKRLIGRKFDDPTVQKDMKNWPFKVIERDSKPKIEIEFKKEKKEFYPEEISAMILAKMKEVAEAYLKQTVKDAVITVPAYFNNSQRQATRDAGRIAGLNVLRIINEPSAAAIAYGFQKKDSESEEKKKILVYDLGGGTFDVSIMTIENKEYKVIATAGDTHLGGEDFDCRVVDHLLKEFERKYKETPSTATAVRRLRTAAEQAKRYLSSANQTSIELDVLFNGKNFSAKISRPRFEELNSDLFKATLKPVEQALTDAGMQKDEIDEIILVGGSTRIPKIQKILSEFFEGKKELNNTINPDEAVAYGAAIQAAILHGDYSVKIFGLILQDVTPLSLGIETNGNHTMSTVIKRNTAIPIYKTERFTTFFNNQTKVRFAVFQGESASTLDNHYLGEFELTGIPPAPAKVQGANVTFEIDSNGILTVTAVDESNQANSKSITIKNTSVHFTNAQIDQMFEEAENYRKKAKEVKELVATKVAFEEKCYEICDALCDEIVNSDGLVSDPGKAILKHECDESIQWLQSEPRATKEEYENRSKKIKDLVSRFMNNFKI